jgi:sRNA-binding protein
MNRVELIADLCGIIDRQNVIIQAQAMELAQLDALHHAEEIQEARRDYADAIGGKPEVSP